MAAAVNIRIFRNCFNSGLLSKKSEPSCCFEVARLLHTTPQCAKEKKQVRPGFKKIDLGGEWRLARGLPRNPNSYGPLTDNVDFTFVDGRPTPLGYGQRKRLERNRIYAEKIGQIVKEMDFAVERHARVVKEKEEHHQAVISSKLKPKAHLLLQSNKESS